MRLWFMLVSVIYVSLRAEYDLFVIYIELFSRLSILLRRTEKQQKSNCFPPLSWFFGSRVGWNIGKFPSGELNLIHVPMGLKHNFCTVAAIKSWMFGC